MRQLTHKAYRIICPLLVALLGLPLLTTSGALRGIAAAVVAAVCLAVIRSFEQQVARVKTQKRLLDEELIQSQKLAAIGELSAGIAHEINNPLAIITQEIEWARHQFKGKTPDEDNLNELEGSLRAISEQVERCSEITHTLLDFARKREPIIQKTDLNKLIEDMARLVEIEGSQKSIKIVRNYRRDIPQALTDAPLLRHVVLNLLNNAAYAIGENGRIDIKTQLPEDKEIEIVISDTGCGIPAENLNKIFDPFFTTKPPGKGTGLGLSLCHSIITKLGGRISADSEPGKGASFTIYLPVDNVVHERE